MVPFRRSTVGSVAVILVTGMLGACRSIAEYASDKVYPDLQTYYDTEAPPTPLAFPASSSVTAVIGGRGEGLNCSIPTLLEWAMFEQKQDDAPISLQFKQACNYHDYCYRHGHATYGYTRSHCDYALQQIAYRVCRVRSNQSPQDCLSRARRVLLGVTLGGGKAFSAHEHSTYFEFDPMPDKADDYVVVRWVNGAEGASIGGKPLNGRFIVMHYKRGTVASRVENFDPTGARIQDPEPQLFPFRHIATPPFVVRDGSVDKLRAVARNNFQDTSIKVVEYKPPVDGRPVEPIAVLDGFDEDPDASVFWFTRGRDDELSYWSYTEDFGTANLANRLRNKQVIRSAYRTLQHAPLEGSFFTPGCIDTAVMKRGGPQANAPDDDGDGFDTHAHLIFVRSASPPCLRPRVTLAATQAHEPLAVVRLDTGRDVLLGIRGAAKRVELSFFDLATAAGTTPVRPIAMTLPEQFDPSWLRIPPQVVSDSQSGASMLFFSRYTRPALEKGGKDAWFEFSYFRLASANGSPGSLVLAGNGRCRIALSGQLAFAATARLGENIVRSFPHRPKRDDKSAYARFFDEQIAPAILGDLNERWANAQVIPGWFLHREGAAGSGPLDVAVFFRGYPQYSFLARGTANGPRAQAALEAVAPSYVECK